MGFLKAPELVEMFDDTPKLAEVDLDQFDAIMVCGGQAPMYQCRGHPDLQRAIAHFYAAEKPTAAMCHGVSALIYARAATAVGLRLTPTSGMIRDQASRRPGGAE